MDLTGIGSVFDFAKTVVTTIWPPDADPAEKARAELAVQAMLQDRDKALLETQKAVMVAEMEQSDTYTKRARPTLVYAGLGFIFLVNVIFPILAFFTSQSTPAISLPAEFWWAWTGVCGVWVIGRSAEKRGVQNKLTKMITG